MWFGYLTLVVAFFLSGVAAYYSVLGLVAIFSAAVIPVIIMGGALETGKVVAAMWLHRNWDRAPWTYKAYLLPSLLALMLLTSMGTFGYLSKAHSDQSLVSGDVLAKISIYDEKIKIAKDNIDANRAALRQLDAGVDQTLARSTSEQGAERSVQIRRQQGPERQRLLREIETEQKKIAELNEERAPISAEVRKVEAEVGPIKYIAALIYGDNPEANLLESAVRWVIILIVVVFDPLAIVLILAGTRHLEWQRESSRPQVAEITTTITLPPATTTTTTVPSTTTTTQAPQTYLTQPWIDCVPGIKFPPQVFRSKVDTDLEVIKVENAGNLTKKQIDRVIAQTEDTPVTTTTTTVQDISSRVQRLGNNYIIIDGKTMTIPVARDLYPELLKEFNQQPKIPGDPDCPPEATFGTSFPVNPKLNHMHINTGLLPSKLYKFNGSQWIEVDKKISDRYTHNEAYIQYLIKKLESGEVGLEDLDPGERSLVEDYIKK